MPKFINETQLSISVHGAWTTVDLSSLVPSNTALVFLKFKNGTGFSEGMQARASGSTDSLVSLSGENANMRDNGLAWQACAVVGQAIEVWTASAAQTIYIFGYMTSDEVYAPVNTASIFVEPATAATWSTVNITSLIPNGIGKVYGVILQCTGRFTGGGGSSFGVRTTTSSDNLIGSQNQQTAGMMAMTVDASNQFQVYSSSISTSVEMRFYIAGFITKNILTIYDTAKNVSPSTLNTYQTISTIPLPGYAGVYDAFGNNNPSSLGSPYYLKGSGLTTPCPIGSAAIHMAVGIVPVGANNQIQGYRASSTGALWERGYWHPPLSVAGLFFGTNF